MTLRKTIFVALLCIPICACADDRYIMSNGSPIVDKDKYSSDLFDCKMDAQDWYRHAPETEDARDNATLAGVFGGLGGAVGGGIGGAVAGNTDHEKMENLMTKKVENCMSLKGYKAQAGNRS